MGASYEIVWHGRGGQGAVTAAKILTEAAYYQGFKGVSAKPTYFSERRGAPVSVHTRIAAEPIRTYSNVLNPDIAVVLDDNLLEMVNVTANLKEGGLLVINSARAARRVWISRIVYRRSVGCVPFIPGGRAHRRRERADFYVHSRPFCLGLDSG